MHGSHLDLRAPKRSREVHVAHGPMGPSFGVGVDRPGAVQVRWRAHREQIVRRGKARGGGEGSCEGRGRAARVGLLHALRAQLGVGGPLPQEAAELVGGEGGVDDTHGVSTDSSVAGGSKEQIIINNEKKIMIMIMIIMLLCGWRFKGTNNNNNEKKKKIMIMILMLD